MQMQVQRRDIIQHGMVRDGLDFLFVAGRLEQSREAVNNNYDLRISASLVTEGRKDTIRGRKYD
jgi:hypothetical protein